MKVLTNAESKRWQEGREQAIDFVKRHGAVLESANGPVPNFAAFVIKSSMIGKYWGHAKSKLIFNLTRYVRSSPDILVCRLVQGKVTYVHRRLWPALVKVSPRFPSEYLSSIREVQDLGGRRSVEKNPFPDWVDLPTRRKADLLGDAEALEILGTWLAKQGEPRL